MVRPIFCVAVAGRACAYSDASRFKCSSVHQHLKADPLGRSINQVEPFTSC